MSKYTGYLNTAKGIMATLEGEKPHSSVSDWVEILSSDRYAEDSLDGIPELLDSINLQGYTGTQEASRAIRKKLKYGNVHRQIRALTILRALSENGSKAFQQNFANQQLLERLKTMAGDPLTDPKVKRKLILVFHAWSVQHKDEPRLHAISSLYAQFAGGGRKPSGALPPSSGGGHGQTTSSRAVVAEPDIYSHSWEPAPGKAGADTYSDLAAAKADAEERKRQRDAKLALEQREADIARRERELQRKKDMTALEETRRKEALEEAERRRKLKEQQKKGGPEPKRPKFDFQKEKPKVLVAVANAIQCANNLVNSCRHVNRAEETLLENVRVQENLDKAKAARRTVIRYIQVVTDEEFVGTLLDANEKIVEAIQLYDTLSRPSVDDSDSEHEDSTPAGPPNREAEDLSRRLEAAKLRSDHTGELDRLRERQKKESAKSQQRRLRSDSYRAGGAHPDLRDLDFGGGIRREEQGKLPPPMQPDEDDDSFRGSLSDFSDYDSSDEEYRRRSQAASRRQSASAPRAYAQQDYQALDDNVGRAGLLDPDDPFSDPFDDETPAQEKPRMEWRAI